MNATSEPQSGATALTNAELEAAQAQTLRDSMLREQNLPMALLMGFCASLAAALIWATIALFTGYQIGWIAIIVGCLVGIAVRYFGRGIEPSFAVTGAALSVFGCTLGNVLVALAILWRRDSISFLASLDDLDIRALLDLWTETFRPLDLLFYAIAAYEGYKLSYRQLPPPTRPPAPV